MRSPHSLFLVFLCLFSASCGDQASINRNSSNSAPGIDADGRMGNIYIGSCQTHSATDNSIIGCQEWQVIAERRDMYGKVIEQCESPANEAGANSREPQWVYQPCPRPANRAIGGCVYPAIEQVSGEKAGDLIIWQYVDERDFTQELVSSLKEACESADNSSEFIQP